MLGASLLTGKWNSLQGKTRAAFPGEELFCLGTATHHLFPFLHRKYLQGIVKRNENSTTWKAPKKLSL